MLALINIMLLSHQKICPRCSQTFSCQAGLIEDCQCSQVSLTKEESLLIAGQYSDCLCLSCLLELKKLSLPGTRYNQEGA